MLDNFLKFSMLAYDCKVDKTLIIIFREGWFIILILYKEPI